MKKAEQTDFLEQENYKNTPAPWMLKLPKILLYVALALALFLVIGTIIAFLTKKDSLGESYRKADPTPQKVINMSKKKDAGVSAYTEIGELRLMTMPEDSLSQGTFLVLTPWFSYPEGDTVFYEELAQRDRQIKSIITDFFASRTETQLRSQGELSVKQELKDLINQELILGKITDVYFEEYIFFE